MGGVDGGEKGKAKERIAKGDRRQKGRRTGRWMEGSLVDAAEEEEG